MVNINRLKALVSAATPGPLMLASSNSWRRIVSVHRGTTTICEPIAQSDGHPDLCFSNGGAEGPDAKLLIEAYNALPHLLDQVARLRGALEMMIECTEEPPEPNCSCHIHPPCADCVDFAGLREAFEFARATLSQGKNDD